MDTRIVLVGILGVTRVVVNLLQDTCVQFALCIGGSTRAAHVRSFKSIMCEIAQSVPYTL